MTSAVWDNPATMSREAWQDGRMISSITARLLRVTPPQNLPFRLNVGPWDEGRIYGSPIALEAPKVTSDG